MKVRTHSGRAGPDTACRAARPACAARLGGTPRAASIRAFHAAWGARLRALPLGGQLRQRGVARGRGLGRARPERQRLPLGLGEPRARVRELIAAAAAAAVRLRTRRIGAPWRCRRLCGAVL